MDHFRNHPLYQKHNIDSAMSSLWDFYKKNFLVLFATSFLMSLAIQYISSLLNLTDLQGITDPSELLEKAGEFIGPIIIMSLINLLFSTILHYFIIYNPVEEDKTIYVSVLKSLRYFLPYLILLVLLTFAGTFAIILGLLAFIVGAFFVFLYVMTLYLFVLPTMMVEGPHIGNTIRRIFKLAHRGFWSNIGWVAVFLILVVIVSVLLSTLTLIPFSGNFLKNVLNPEAAENVVDLARNPLYIVLAAMANALTFPLVSIFAAILYFNGRASEEEVQPLSGEPEEVKVRVEDLYAKPYSDENVDNPERDQSYEK